MTQFNDSSTGYQGVLPDDRNEAKDDGLLNAYAHMYDVVKEDKYRVEAINDEIAARQSADDAISKRFDDINVIAPHNVDKVNTVRGSGIAFGSDCVSENGCISIGYHNRSFSKDSVSIGNYATAENGSVSIGLQCTSTKGVAIGNACSCDVYNSVAIGTNAVTEEINTVSFNDGNSLNRIVNNATPVNDNDVATKGYVDGLIPSDLVTFLKTLPAMQFGCTDSAISIEAGETMYLTIYFIHGDGAFETTPYVFITPYCNSNTAKITINIQSVGVNGCSFAFHNIGTENITNLTFDWLAIAGR